ncbi:PLP-dependent transferase [Aureobasidium melanogenum CBS 110374]|uniref:PLP-dependent transferase n=1 Tax=Aureobasidium melanogenum (strain CBS 110374) TaxID=1043003 RepID=A0A074WY44_AURM1|nr:PLP-dependent transferase [Aureobasidium melanogenum CBS 110374]KEQ67311.1 PLP-dependent transferase [Aureobasidium melanogenum CBS 110374]
MASSESINLIKGWPSTSLLPTDHLSRAAHKALADTSVAFPGLLYGPDEGYTPLRESLATWLTSFYHPEQPIAKERITITGGASQNLACLLQVFTDPAYTRDILFAAPAYMLAFRVFEDNGFSGKMKAVPEDDDGMDMAALRRALEESEKRSPENKTLMFKPPRPYAKYYRHIIYCVPTFSNPSSRTLPLDRRIELVKLAREFDALVISDDVYDFLQWSADSNTSDSITKALLPRLVDIDRFLDGGAERPGADLFGNTTSSGSFSKIAGPGLRVGWSEGSPKFAYGVSQTGSSCSGGAPSQLTSTYMNILVNEGTMSEHIFKVLQPAYASRYKTLASAIKEHLYPLGVKLPQPNQRVVGGYFLWVTLPDNVKAIDFAKRCQDEAQVIVAPGSIFEVPGDDSVKFEHSIRLTFSWIDEHLMVEAVKRISTVLERCLKGEATIEAPKQSKVSENPY